MIRDMSDELHFISSENEQFLEDDWKPNLMNEGTVV